MAMKIVILEDNKDRQEVMRAIDDWRDERGIYRSRSDHRFVIARKA